MNHEHGIFQTPYYVTYLIACVVVIGGLALVLHWAANVFLKESFDDRPEIGRAVGRLLDIGFYLVSVVYAAMTSYSYVTFNTMGDLVDVVTTKLGGLLLLMGFLHVCNLLILALFRGRRGGMRTAAVS
jgi:hypothetical protein